MTNAEFARSNVVFREACEEIGVEATATQASKFRDRRGIVWRWLHEPGLDVKRMVGDIQKSASGRRGQGY